MVAAADGSSIKDVTPESRVGNAMWRPTYSPDGSLIAFAAYRGSSSDAGVLYGMRPDGTGLWTLRTMPVSVGGAGGPDWAPDPAVQRIAYDTMIGGTQYLRVLDLETGLDHNVGPGFWPSWSPDDSMIAMCCVHVSTTSRILDDDPDDRVKFAQFGSYCDEYTDSPGRTVCSRAIWSPDGSKLMATDLALRSGWPADDDRQPPDLAANRARRYPPAIGSRPAPRRAGRRVVRRVGTIGRMAHRVTLIPGDGIGPELAEATRRVLDATGIEFEWETVDAGEAVIAEYGTPLPDHVLESIRRNRVALKGPITTPVGEGFRSVNVTLRQALGLYANLRPARSMKGLETRYEDVDLVIVRENTEDLYAGIEHMVGPDAAESIKIITRAASERIARFAFDYAVANGRRKVTAVHKANIMKLSDGLFLDSCRTVAAEYDGRVEFEDRIVDNMCMQLVQKPELYDVLVLPNLYGDIVSDLAAGLVGGLGVAPGANIGTEAAVFEPVHGSAPKYAGQDKANPTALILSGALMLRHLGHPDTADRVERALRDVIAEGRVVTYDLGGTAGTKAFAEAIIERLAATPSGVPAQA
jgi:isocitrate dehydrogenase (NAD+)